MIQSPHMPWIWTLVIIAMVVTWGVSRKKSSQEKKAEWTKFFVYIFLLHVIWIVIWNSPTALSLTTELIWGIGAWELYQHRQQLSRSWKLSLLVIYPLLGIGFMMQTYLPSSWVARVFLLTWIFDAFSQVVGKWIGRHPILPRISPSKTWEGWAGGTLIMMIMAVSIPNDTQPYLEHAEWFTVGLGAVAFWGDAFFSSIKRHLNIKDYSKLLPGQGGFLDRFDSWIFTSTLSTIYYFIFFTP
jgi:phosphatidate cytidylyltransferase